MKFLLAVVILSLAFLINIPNSFSQDNSVSFNGASPSSSEQPPGHIENPLPSVETKGSNDVIPTLSVPIEIPPVQVEAESEVMPDTHVVIESVPTSIQAMPDRAPVMHNAFDRIKQLAGRWEGSGAGNSLPGEKQEKVAVVYEVTSGGHAVLERIFPGTSQEMITVYYDNKGKLNLMHFFMIGTRSVMTLNSNVNDNDAIFSFKLLDNSGLDPEVDTHMNSLQISFIDENRINQVWTMFEAGEQSGTYTFSLTRILSEN